MSGRCGELGSTYAPDVDTSSLENEEILYNLKHFSLSSAAVSASFLFNDGSCVVLLVFPLLGRVQTHSPLGIG